MQSRVNHHLRLISILFIALLVDRDDSVHRDEMKMVGGKTCLRRDCTLKVVNLRLQSRIDHHLPFISMNVLILINDEVDN